MAMTNAMWVILVVGIVIGYFVGRWWAEVRRARFDMDRVWGSRKNYRDG
jgi:preprotein translocase subunit Sec63